APRSPRRHAAALASEHRQPGARLPTGLRCGASPASEGRQGRTRVQADLGQDPLSLRPVEQVFQKRSLCWGRLAGALLRSTVDSGVKEMEAELGQRELGMLPPLGTDGRDRLRRNTRFAPLRGTPWSGRGWRGWSGGLLLAQTPDDICIDFFLEVVQVL